MGRIRKPNKKLQFIEASSAAWDAKQAELVEKNAALARHDDPARQAMLREKKRAKLAREREKEAASRRAYRERERAKKNAALARHDDQRERAQAERGRNILYKEVFGGTVQGGHRDDCGGGGGGGGGRGGQPIAEWLADPAVRLTKISAKIADLGAEVAADLLDLDESDIDGLQLKKLEAKRLKRGIQALAAAGGTVPAPKPRRKKVIGGTGGKYHEMARDAILHLRARNGSSQPAIEDWIQRNHPDVDIERNRHLLCDALRTAVDRGHFLRIKNSWKINRNN